MTIDDTVSRSVPAGSLSVHRVAPDGSPGVPVAVARTVTTSAAIIEPVAPLDPADVPDVLESRPEPPELPLLLVDETGRAFPVLHVHTSDRSPAIALEIEEPVLTVLPSENADGSPDPLPGRSVWCTIFPRMRGC